MTVRKYKYRTDISIHAKWKEPLFKKGYTEYSVVRETIRFFEDSSHTYSRESMTVLLKTDNFEKAVNFRKEIIEKGVTSV